MPEQDQKSHSVEATAYDVFISIAAIASIAIVSWLFAADPDAEQTKLLNHFDDFFCLRLLHRLSPADLQGQEEAAVHLRGSVRPRIVDPRHRPASVSENDQDPSGARALRSLRILVQVFKSDVIGATIVSSMTMSMGGIILACFGVLHYESEAIGANLKTADDVIWWAGDDIDRRLRGLLSGHRPRSVAGCTGHDPRHRTVRHDRRCSGQSNDLHVTGIALEVDPEAACMNCSTRIMNCSRRSSLD